MQKFKAWAKQYIPAEICQFGSNATIYDWQSRTRGARTLRNIAGEALQGCIAPDIEDYGNIRGLGSFQTFGCSAQSGRYVACSG